MASNESSKADTIGGENANERGELNAAATAETASHTPRTAAYRGVRFATDSVALDEEDESWWWEVENENLTLDQVPNVTAVFSHSPEDIIEKPQGLEETAIIEENDFERIHRLADRIKQRVRHLSESSDKSLSDGGKQEFGQDSTLESPKEQSLEEFKVELREKRLARQTGVQGFRDEIASLRKQLENEREISRRLRNGETVEEISSDKEIIKTTAAEKIAAAIASHKDDDLQEACFIRKLSTDEDDVDPLSRSRHANIELANAQLSLQMANSENFSLRGELAGVQKQVGTLKEVVACCKQMLAVKEEQCNELKDRLTEIEKAFAEHEMKIMSDNLRQEYERQLVNIRQLRQLYEERQRVAAAEYENLQRLISIKRDELAQEQEKTKTMEERNAKLVRELDDANNELACLRDEVKEHKFEKSSLKEEIGAVNTLFSQMVMGFNGKNNLDIDRLTTMLEENRTLLNDMATKECTDGATLPKLLFELVQQASIENAGKKMMMMSSNLGDVAEITNEEEPRMLNKTSGENDNNENNDEENIETTSTSQTEDEGDVEDVNVDVNAVEANDNENMASVANDNVAQALETTITAATATATATPTTTMATQPLMAAEQQQEQQQSNSDVVDSTSSYVGGSASSVAASVTNEKVIVSTCLSAKSKKSHHHHRKAGCSKKSNSTATASTSSATLKFNDTEVIGKITSAQEIIGNLPKVWRVLMELLSHHQIDPVQFEENGKGEDCYKSVETPNGPKAELSVSKTYLKLKDLILEKKSLVKETNRLKTLNCHLDYRLNEQEKRLSAVSLELTKTWHLVGKMQRQHRQLHTQEQILRYQLQQKRRLLHELKDELEYCRRKWQAARAKNDESQEQCNDLRREFARRKLEDANNSAESGYSDSGGQVSDEEAVVAVASGEVVTAMLEDEDEELRAAGATAMLEASTAAGGCASYRRKRLREQFEHTRKIKRMQSTSPGRANNGAGENTEEVMVLRWNSAPPTCGWRDVVGEPSDDSEEDEETLPTSSGAIPKIPSRLSRRPKRRDIDVVDGPENQKDEVIDNKEHGKTPPDERTARILRLEQQCKNLIQQVLETSDNRERLEVQLKRFQDEMSPVQYAVPLNEVINKKRIERMTRASSVPLTGSGSLTPREEEYTRKRSERLGRLEEESRQLMFRIKRTSDRGHYLRCSLDRIRRAPPSREGSFESNTEEEVRKTDEEPTTIHESKSTNSSASSSASASANASKEDSPSTLKTEKSPLTTEEEAYTARRSARLQRLEEESKQLLNSLSRNNTRGTTIGARLDTLHERHGSQTAESAAAVNQQSTTSVPLTTEQRIENIEKITSNRQERLRILEEEGRQLINRLSETSEKGTKMINRIAERELSRQNRSTPQRETAEAGSDNKPGRSASIRNPLPDDANTQASALLPPLKNVACSSIVSEELTDRVTITTIPSQIATNQGAIPKSKPTSQLLASRPKSARIRAVESVKKENAFESLEDMVRRLQSLPFPKKEEETRNEEIKVNENATPKEEEKTTEIEEENKVCHDSEAQQIKHETNALETPAGILKQEINEKNTEDSESSSQVNLEETGKQSLTDVPAVAVEPHNLQSPAINNKEELIDCTQENEKQQISEINNDSETNKTEIINQQITEEEETSETAAQELTEAAAFAVADANSAQSPVNKNLEDLTDCTQVINPETSVTTSVEQTQASGDDSNKEP